MQDFTEIDSPYEEPVNLELVIDTDLDSVEDCVNKIIIYLQAMKLI